MVKKHYQPLYNWIKGTLLGNNLISKEDIGLVNLVDDKDEVEEILTSFFKANKIDINFD